MTLLFHIIPLAKHSPMTFTNVLENLSIVGMQSRQLDSTVFNDAEEAGNGGNQIESKQPFVFQRNSYMYSMCCYRGVEI